MCVYIYVCVHIYICIYISESVCCTLESNTTLKTNYNSKNKNKTQSFCFCSFVRVEEWLFLILYLFCPQQVFLCWHLTQSKRTLVIWLYGKHSREPERVTNGGRKKHYKEALKMIQILWCLNFGGSGALAIMLGILIWEN